MRPARIGIVLFSTPHQKLVCISTCSDSSVRFIHWWKWKRACCCLTWTGSATVNCFGNTALPNSYTLLPQLADLHLQHQLVFIGVLMGIAIRTGSPLSLNLAEPIWKLLSGMELTPIDLTEMDRDYVPGLLCIRNMSSDEFQNLEMPFSTPSSCGADVPLSTKYKKITFENRTEYVRLALNFRYVLGIQIRYTLFLSYN